MDMSPIHRRGWFSLVCLGLMWSALPGCVTPKINRPTPAQINLEQAKLYLEQGLPDSALAAFSLALEDNPRLSVAHLGIGHIYRTKGKTELATQAYEKAYEIEPNKVETNYYLGLARQQSGRLGDAVTLYLRAVQLDPDDYAAQAHLATAYMQLGRPSDALPHARRAAEHTNATSADWANLGACYSLLGRHDDAAGAYQYAIEKGDQRPELAVSLAQALIQMERYPQAIDVLQPLVRTQPLAVAYERLGYAQFKLRKFDDALASYRAALASNAQDSASLNGLGVCLMTLYLQGHRATPALRDEALSAWQKSLKLNANQPRIMDLLNRYQKI